jgi:hypothetical protein
VPPTPCQPRRRNRLGGRAPALLLISVAWLGVVACRTVTDLPVDPVDPPPPPPGPVEGLDLVAGSPIAAAYVLLERPAGTSLVSVAPLQDDLIVRASADGERIRIAWVGGAAAAGPQVRVDLVRGDDATGSPAILAASVFATREGADLGRTAIAWSTTQAAAPTTRPLQLAAFDHAEAAPALRAAFADHPLGDLDADGDLGVRDALELLERIRDGGWSDFTRYHGDLDGDDVSDVSDVRLLLDRLVDPTLPARAHVKPRQVGFAQLDGTTEEGVVLVANQGRLPFVALAWEAPAGVAARVAGGIDGHSLALDLSLPVRSGWLPGFLRVRDGAGGEFEVRVGHLVVLIAGQSNAQGVGAPLTGWPEAPTGAVRMLGNDYVWKHAVEPLDDPVGQLDLVSRDDSPLYSFGTRLGTLLHEATGFTTYLIPAARGATRVLQWRPGSDRLDRETLFGSAAFRSHVSAGHRTNPVGDQPHPSEGGPVSAVVWYQGESDDRPKSRRDAFVGLTNEVMDGFAAELGAPVVYVQLATSPYEDQTLFLHAIGELQRRMETGSGDAVARPGFHMVVAFDLPRSDRIHLSAFGLRILAERIDLAVREHVLGEAVDGTGPRLAELRSSGTTIDVVTTRPLASGALDRALFTVFDGPPTGSIDEVEYYGDNAIPIESVALAPGDVATVRLTLGRPPTATPYVSYVATPKGPTTSGPSAPELWDVVAAGVVRGAGSGLPLPLFGPLPAAP